MKNFTKGIVAVIVAIGALLQEPTVLNAVLALLSGHPRIATLVATVVAAWLAAHNPKKTIEAQSQTKSEAGFSRFAVLPILLMLTLTASFIGCAAHRAGTGQPVTKWEQVMIDNDLLAQANNTLAKTVVNVHTVMPDKLSTEQTAKILRAQKRIARSHNKLTVVLNQGPSVVTLSDVNPLIAEIRAAANEMISSGDLNIVDPQSKVTIKFYVDQITTMTQAIVSAVAAVRIGPAAHELTGTMPVMAAGIAPVPMPSGPAGIMLLIAQLASLALSTAPLAVEQILKIRKLLEQSPDVAANLKAIFDDTIETNDETIQLADDWFKAHGLDPDTLQPDVPSGSAYHVVDEIGAGIEVTVRKLALQSEATSTTEVPDEGANASEVSQPEPCCSTIDPQTGLLIHAR